MSTVKSWDIVENRPRRSARHASSATTTQEVAQPAPTQAAQAQTAYEPARFQKVRSTGFFATPPEEGIPTNLSIFLSSFASQSHQVTVRVHRLIDGRPQEIFARHLEIPPSQGRRLDVDDVAGFHIEVIVDAPKEIVPSASVYHYFIADGGIVVTNHRAPGDFVWL